MSTEHYLKNELYGRAARDSAIFDLLQSACTDGIWYWDLEKPEHQWMSPRFWELLGYDPASRQHRTSEWQGLMQRDDLHMVLENFDQHCADPNRPFDQYVRYTHQDGSTVWLRCRGVAIRDAAGRPIRMLGTHTDVTALKQAEEDSQRLATQLAAANRELEAFSYSVSHDLRAPLRAVDGFSQMLVEDCAGQLDDDGRRMLGLIREGAQRMSRLIDDLLAFSRLGRQQIEPVAIDMHALAREVFDELAAREPGRELRLDLQPLPPARGTPAMLRQLWANLIGNALKFTKGRAVGEIGIAAREGEDGAQIYSVKDNGAGFDMRHAGRLFGMFQRLHSEEDFPGTGVGLALVQRIVQRHAGLVWAEAEVGRGATFFFMLPNPKS